MGNLVQSLPAGPLDIVGDIHGEVDALRQLLSHLGYDAQGRHPQGRTLVFVGDFCDRGPNSPAVFSVVERLVTTHRAVAILGNHEINLLRRDAKDGSGWFFDERVQRDQSKYAPFRRASVEQRDDIARFVATLPLALERSDLRIVHATWDDAAIQVVRALPLGSVISAYDHWQRSIQREVQARRLVERVKAERTAWGGALEDPSSEPPVLHATAQMEVIRQMGNPIKILTSGVERETAKPFFTSGKWRFAERVRWWDMYAENTPILIGHYWRLVHPIDRSTVGKQDPNLFEQIPPLSWHGQRGNVFCVDFSVGGRWRERKSGQPLGQTFKLAALRWPERTILFDDGSQQDTQGFRAW